MKDVGPADTADAHDWVKQASISEKFHFMVKGFYASNKMQFQIIHERSFFEK